MVDWTKETTSFATFKSFMNSGNTLYVHLHEQADPIKCTSGHRGDFERAVEYVKKLADGDAIKYQSRGVDRYSPKEWFYRIDKIDTAKPDPKKSEGNIQDSNKKSLEPFKEEEKTSQKVFGPPGTGKTTLMMKIVEKRLAEGIMPNEICFISFTNVAANEAVDKALKRFPQYSKSDFQFFKTIHALATALGGLDGKKVMSYQDMESFDKTILSSTVWTEKGKNESIKVRSEHPCLTVRSLAVARKTRYEYQIKNIDSDQLIEAISKSCSVNNWVCPEFETVVSALYFWMNAYDKYKEEHNFVDYDDVIYKVLSPDFDNSKLRFKLLIIDEAQDCSDFMWDFLKLLIKESKEVYIVGDDDQAIMDGFGANSQAFLEFKTTEDDRPLTESYRLCKAHHQNLISENGPLELLKKFKLKRKEKKFTHNGKQNGTIVSQVPNPNDAKNPIPLSLEKLLRIVQLNQNEQWLIMAPTRNTVDKISNGLISKRISHYKNNEPQYIGNGCDVFDIRVQTIHTSKGAESDKVGVVVLSITDNDMYRNALSEKYNPALRYVAESRSKKDMYLVSM